MIQYFAGGGIIIPFIDGRATIALKDGNILSILDCNRNRVFEEYGWNGTMAQASETTWEVCKVGPGREGLNLEMPEFEAFPKVEPSEGYIPYGHVPHELVVQYILKHGWSVTRELAGDTD
jgi:hypothetical protein